MCDLLCFSVVWLVVVGTRAVATHDRYLHDSPVDIDLGVKRIGTSFTSTSERRPKFLFFFILTKRRSMDDRDFLVIQFSYVIKRCNKGICNLCTCHAFQWMFCSCFHSGNKYKIKNYNMWCYNFLVRSNIGQKCDNITKSMIRKEVYLSNNSNYMFCTFLLIAVISGQWFFVWWTSTNLFVISKNNHYFGMCWWRMSPQTIKI